MGHGRLRPAGTVHRAGYHAIYYLTRAQEWAEKLDNPFYSGMAFREIGSAYLLSFNYPEAIENEKKAIAAFEKAGKPLHAAPYTEGCPSSTTSCRCGFELSYTSLP